MSILKKGVIREDTLYTVLPIAFELARDDEGKVICGPETAAACDAAIDVTLEIPKYCAEIVTTAGYVANGWNVVMARVMKEYIENQTFVRNIDPAMPIVSAPSPAFNTEGELRHLLTLIGKRMTKRRPHLVVVVKNWHALRVWILLCLMGWEASWAGRLMPDWTIVKIPSNVPYLHRMREFIAIPENFFRIVWKNLCTRR